MREYRLDAYPNNILSDSLAAEWGVLREQFMAKGDSDEAVVMKGLFNLSLPSFAYFRLC